jgi:uncharacterized protein (DUF779 family)
MNHLPMVRATPKAISALEELARTVGPLVVVQSAGCCDGSAPMVLPASDFPLGDNDIRVGEVAGVGVYIAARELNAWPHGDMLIDIEPGYADGMSLTPADDLHFVAHSPSCSPTPQANPDWE